jgi:Zn-dependent alcohol dehydrogenase
MAKVTASTFVKTLNALANRGEAAAETLRELGEYAVKSAYSNQNFEPAATMLNRLPAYWKKPLATWFKGCGLDVVAPTSSVKMYIVAQLTATANQGKAFGRAATTPVVQVELKDVKVKADKELQGTALDRAKDAVRSSIKRMAEKDELGAAALNDMLTKVFMVEAMQERIKELEAKLAGEVELPQLKAA